uniref:Uncharacterized protein n=1 Tax=Esox lucius TaxID=8010 RepID=A0A3P8YPF5_ESOLU
RHFLFAFSCRAFLCAWSVAGPHWFLGESPVLPHLVLGEVPAGPGRVLGEILALPPQVLGEIPVLGEVPAVPHQVLGEVPAVPHQVLGEVPAVPRWVLGEVSGHQLRMFPGPLWSSGCLIILSSPGGVGCWPIVWVPLVASSCPGSPEDFQT